MALAAALTVFMALLQAGRASTDNSTSLEVTCEGPGSSTHQKEVTAANTVLTVMCPVSWEVEPPANDQNVCTDADCTDTEPLADYFGHAVEVPANDTPDTGPGVKITFKKLPQAGGTFHINCHNGSGKNKCDVKVILKKPSTGSSGADGVPQSPSGGGTPDVQICEPKSSITLRIPQKGSMAQFACVKDFVLYPTNPDEVFSKDCKTKESLSDMKRTETPAAGTATDARSEESKTYTYTLTADKKPSKKTLCYLCADKKINEKDHGAAADYCTIYVESDARIQLDLNFTFILALPCVLAALHFT